MYLIHLLFAPTVQVSLRKWKCRKQGPSTSLDNSLKSIKTTFPLSRCCVRVAEDTLSRVGALLTCRSFYTCSKLQLHSSHISLSDRPLPLCYTHSTTPSLLSFPSFYLWYHRFLFFLSCSFIHFYFCFCVSCPYIPSPPLPRFPFNSLCL